MAMTDEELVEFVKTKVAEKDEVIRDQVVQTQELEAQIEELKGQVQELQDKLAAAEEGAAGRDKLVDEITDALKGRGLPA